MVSLDSQSRAATCCGCHECSEEKIRLCLPYSAPPYCLTQLTVGWISGDMDLSDERCQTNLECEDKKGGGGVKGHKRNTSHQLKKHYCLERMKLRVKSSVLDCSPAHAEKHFQSFIPIKPLNDSFYLAIT